MDVKVDLGSRMRGNKKFVDLSGYMFSGKSAVSDLLREFEGVHSKGYQADFDLIRFPGGLRDLKLAFEDWSVVGVDAAVRKFEKNISQMASDSNGFRRLYTASFGYSEVYPGINKFTSEFIQSITDISWDICWPYALLELSPFQVFCMKLRAKLTKTFGWPTIKYRLCSGDNFEAEARRYLENLLSTEIDDNTKFIVTNNALEPFSPTSGFCFFNDIRSIVIDRDVRDIYMTGATYSEGFNDQVDMYSRISGAFDVDVFIKRQKILREKTDYAPHPQVLRVQFEDLILEYEKTKKIIMAFLDLPSESHTKEKEYFNPKLSMKNIGLWKSATGSHAENIRRIENELSSLCYQSK